MTDSEEPDKARREALKKLASMTAYSTPTLVTLLTPTLSHAQTSEALNNPANANNGLVVLCQNWFLPTNLGGGLGNDPGGGIFSANDTPGDCGS